MSAAELEGAPPIEAGAPGTPAGTAAAPKETDASPKPKAKAREGGNSAKAVLIAIGVVLYVVLAGFAIDFASGAIVKLSRHESVRTVELGTTYEAWQAAAVDPNPKVARKVRIAVIFPAVFFLLVIPAGVGIALSASKTKLYGDARFTSDPEIRASEVWSDHGIVVGKYRDRYLMYPGEQSVMLAAPPGEGKGAGIVIPNLLSWQDSAVVLDVKPELFRITGGFRAKHGQAVYCWSPFDTEGRTHGYNPLHYVRTEFRYVAGDVLNLAQIIYAGKADDNSTSGFFLDNARNLFLGLALYLVETPELPRTIGEMLRLASGKGRPIKEFLESLIDERAAAGRPLSMRCEDALRRVLASGGEGDTFGNIISTFNGPLTLFTDALVDSSTSRNDFDLRQLRRKRMTVYVEIPAGRIVESKVLLNLFFSQLIKLNIDVTPEDDPSILYHLLLVMDEFATLGHVPIFAECIGIFRGYWIRLLTILQSPAQNEANYGPHVARTMRTCHGATVVFTPSDQKDAEEISTYLGHLTAESKSRSSSHGKGGNSSSTNTGEQKRALLWPQELKFMPETEQIILLKRTRPMKVDRIRYFEDPTFTSRLLPPPVIPQVDLELYQARVEGRIREVRPDEPFTLERLVADFNSLPPIDQDSDEAEVAALVGKFLDQLSQGTFAVPGEAAVADAANDAEDQPPAAAAVAGTRPRRGRTSARGGLSPRNPSK